jgi:aminoglycoside phosphotransferase (APT) family kinase protein
LTIGSKEMDVEQIVECSVDYLKRVDLWGIAGWRAGDPFKVSHLAHGEYNINLLLQQGRQAWVFRVNIGTQIGREDQILYEYRTLRLLEQTGLTPRPFYVDDTRQHLPFGILIMEYLPGEALDYTRDLESAARLFARIHSHHVPAEANHLIQEKRPLSMMVEECTRLMCVYLESELANPDIKEFLKEVLAWAEGTRHREAYFLSNPWPCIINTEVNSGNFIANRERGTLHLVDWEKPLWGDPSQDLSHFSVPTTTLWKTGYRMSAEDRRIFLDTYRQSIHDPHLRDSIEDRVRLRDPFNCLRGISWSAMAWVAYQAGDHQLRNQETFNKISSYLEMGFLRSLFDPYLCR